MTTRALNALLSALGLMRVSEHEVLVDNSVAFHLRRSKLAATDLATKSMALCDAQAELRATEALLIARENELAAERERFKDEIGALQANRDSAWGNYLAEERKFKRAAGDVAALTEQVEELRAEINSLRPDALLWRAARQKRRKSPQPDSQPLGKSPAEGVS